MYKPYLLGTARSAFLLLAAACAFHGRAQTFQIEEFIPLIGAPYFVQEVSGDIPFDTIPGVNEFWDFSNLSINAGSPGGQMAIPLGTASSLSYYPDADMVDRSPVDMQSPVIMERYYDQQGDVIHYLGSDGTFISTGSRTMYSDPSIAYAALSLGDTLTDAFCYEQYVPQFLESFYYCGSKRMSFTSTGTLQLPYGTYTGARLITERTDSWDLNEPEQITTELVQNWYLPGSPRAVLQTLIIWDQGQFLLSTGSIFTQASLETVGIGDGGEVNGLSAYPDPAVDHITLTGMGHTAAVVSVHASDGRCARNELFPAGADQLHMDVHELPAGVYVAFVNSSGRTSVVRFMKQ